MVLRFISVFLIGACLHAQDKNLADLSLEELMKLTVSTAALHTQLLQDAPASVTVITREDIRKYGYLTLADALGAARGMFTTFDRSYHFLGARGFSLPGDYGSRLLLLVNGQSVTDNILGQSVWFGEDFPLDMNLVKRIEIVRGPSSALYGSNGIFATINVVTLSPEEFRGTQVRADVGSFGAKKLQTASSVALGRGAKLLLSASALNNRGEHSIYIPEFDSPDTNHGRAINMAGEKGYHLFGNLSWGRWSVMALFGDTSRTQVVSWGQTIFNDPGTHVVDAPNTISATYTHDFDASRSLQWRTYYGRYRFRGIFRYALEEGSEDNRQEFTGDWIGSQLSYRFALPRLGSLTVGATGQSDLRALQQSFNVAPVRQTLTQIDKRDHSLALFAQDELNLSQRWKLNLGARFDYSLYRHDFISPRIALIYQPSPRVSYKLLHGRAFRNPTAFELFYTDEQAQTIANPAARPEKANSFEFVMEHKLGRDWNALLSTYRYGINDLLVGEYTAGDLFQYHNSDSIRASGVEMELNGHLSQRLEFAGSLAIQRAVNSRYDYPLPNSPGQIAKIRLAVPLFNRRLSLANSMQYMGSRKTLAHATLPPVFRSDVILSSTRVLPNLDFQAGVKNIFGEKHSDPLALDSRVDRLRVPGRSFFISLTWRSSD